MDYSCLAISLGFLFLSIFCKILRWRFFLRLQGAEYPLPRSSAVFFIGQFFATVTPGRIGDVVKIFYVEKETPLTHFKALAGVVIDRAFDILTLLTVASFCVAEGVLEGNQRIYLLGTAAFFAVLVVFLVNSTLSAKLFSVLESIPFIKKFLNRDGEFISETIAILKKLVSKNIVFPVLITGGAYFLLYCHAYYLAHALHIDLTLSQATVVLTIASVAALVPFSIGGMGPREAATKHLFVAILGGAGPLSVELNDKLSAQGVAFSVAYHLIFAVSIGLIGFVLWMRTPLSFESIRRFSASLLKKPLPE